MPGRFTILFAAGLLLLAACNGKAPDVAIADGAPAFSTAAPATAPAPVTPAEIAQFEQRFAGQKLWPVLKQHFPEDYHEMVSTSIGLAKAGASVTEMQLASAKAQQALRAKYVDQGAQASDTTLTKLLTAALQVQMHVKEAKGEAACDAYASQGLLGLDDIGFLQAEMDDFAVLMFQTMAEGRDHPATVAPPTDADLDQVLKDVVAHGVSEAAIASLQNPDKPPPQGTACAFATQFLRSVISLPDDAGHRVRADMARTVLLGGFYR
ncbi:MAG TPA: hypothetical protein VG942_07100 [Hyphomonadaceae bacterium]|nr:hypothetical protein [Hyphomonadaceae bacterium]